MFLLGYSVQFDNQLQFSSNKLIIEKPGST